LPVGWIPCSFLERLDGRRRRGVEARVGSVEPEQRLEPEHVALRGGLLQRLHETAEAVPAVEAAVHTAADALPVAFLRDRREPVILKYSARTPEATGAVSARSGSASSGTPNSCPYFA
jgi:hypothetical protein